jgi:hypothetical protein
MRAYLSTAFVLIGLAAVPAAAPAATPETATGFGVCAHCALHVASECCNVLLTDDGRNPGVYIIEDTPLSKQFHHAGRVCKTTVPIKVTCEVKKDSRVDLSGAIEAGQVTASAIEKLAGCDEEDDTTMAGVIRCATCAEAPEGTCAGGSDCQLVLVCHIDGKNLVYGLEPGNATGRIHRTLGRGMKAVVVRGRVTREATADAAGAVAVTSLSLIRKDVVDDPFAGKGALVRSASAPVRRVAAKPVAPRPVAPESVASGTPAGNETAAAPEVPRNPVRTIAGSIRCARCSNLVSVWACEPCLVTVEGGKRSLYLFGNDPISQWLLQQAHASPGLAVRIKATVSAQPIDKPARCGRLDSPQIDLSQ